MYYISVYDDTERHLGWIDSGGHLNTDKAQRAGFSSQQTADDLRFRLEIENKDWYTELEQ